MTPPFAPRLVTDQVPVPIVDIVIVNWNSGPYLRACLAALHGSGSTERFNVIVVDNASTDHSASDLPTGRATFR